MEFRSPDQIIVHLIAFSPFVVFPFIMLFMWIKDKFSK